MIGVLTHLDSFKARGVVAGAGAGALSSVPCAPCAPQVNKHLKKTKKELKMRFWTDVYQVRVRVWLPVYLERMRLGRAPSCSTCPAWCTART